MAQRACSIAGYLANQFVKTSLTKVIADIGTGATLVAIVADIMATIAGAGELTPVITAATYELYNAIQGGTLSHYTDARDSSQFWSDVTCSINSAISGTGFVTASNFAAVLSNLATTPYAHGDVVSTVHDYVQTLGVDGVRQIQAVGAVALVDCTGCAPSAGCVVFPATVVGTGAALATTGANASRLTISAGSTHYAGALGTARLASDTWSVRGRVSASYGFIGMISSPYSSAYGGPNAGNNNWVNEIDRALGWSAGTWYVLDHGSIVLTGSSAPSVPVELEVDYSPASGGTFTCKVNGVVQHTQIGVSHAYLPVCLGNPDTTQIVNLQVCS